MTNRGDRGNLIVRVTRTSSHKTISTLAPHQCAVWQHPEVYPTNRNGSCTRAAANRPEVVVVVELIQSSARPSDLRSAVVVAAATDSRKSPSALK